MTRDIVVVGASAGGVDAIARVVRNLPPDLSATLFVVLHVSPNYTSVLPRILARVTPLGVSHAVDGERFEQGRIYVAPSDHHLLLTPEGTISLSRGPRENRSRPAVDPLFRTAALAYGPRVIGVVLSGTLGDGTAGLRIIKRMGGMAIVQDPEEAPYDGMPRNAIEHVDVDHVVSVDAIGELLGRMVSEPIPDPQNPGDGPPPAFQENNSPGNDSLTEIVRERLLARLDLQDADLAGGEETGDLIAPVPLVCPDCGGTLWEVRQAGLPHYRCQIGHRYSTEALVYAQSEKLESALWAATRALEEQASMLKRLAARMSKEGSSDLARRYEEQADMLYRQAETVRNVAEASALFVPGAGGSDPPADNEVSP